MHAQLHAHADEHSHQEIRRENANDCAYKNQQLLTADLVHIDEFIRRGQSAACVDQHGGQRGQRHLADQAWHKRDKCQQENAVPQIGPSRLRTVVDIGLTPDDF